MQAYDIAMIVVFLGTAAWGYMKGLAWQVASIASFVASYFVAMAFRGLLAPLLPGEPPLNNVLAMLILFVATSLVVWLGFRFVSEAIEKLKLKSFDRQIGALVGAAKGVLYCVAITLFAATLLEGQRESIVSSRSGYYVSRFLIQADPLLPDGVKETIEPYVAKLDGAAPPKASENPLEHEAQELADKLFDTSKDHFSKRFDALRGKVQETFDNSAGQVQDTFDNSASQVRDAMNDAAREAEEDLEMVDVKPPTSTRQR